MALQKLGMGGNRCKVSPMGQLIFWLTFLPLEILNREGIISEGAPDGITGQDPWQRTYDYFKERQITLDNPDALVHTVDIQLQQVESQIGPLQ